MNGSNLPNQHDFKPSNMVVGIELSTQFDVELISQILPLYPVPTYVAATGVKPKIGFYGVNDTAIGVRWGHSSRGVRAASQRSMGSFTELDIQINNQNVHTKLSPHKINIMGVKDIELALDSLNLIGRLLYMTDTHLILLASTDPSIITAAMHYLKVTAVLTDIFDNGTLRLYWDVDSLTHATRLPNTLPEELVQLLVAHGFEYDDFEEFGEFVAKLYQHATTGRRCVSSPEYLASEDFKTQPLNLAAESYKINNSVYNWKLIFSPGKVGIILADLVAKILELEDPSIYGAFHNWSSKHAYFQVTYQLTRQDGTIQDILHRFNLSQGGTMRQWSPSSKEQALEAGQHLVASIQRVVDKNPEILW